MYQTSPEYTYSVSDFADDYAFWFAELAGNSWGIPVGGWCRSRIHTLSVKVPPVSMAMRRDRDRRGME